MLIFCPLVLTIGQNLVLNGGLEAYSDCPDEEGNFEGYVDDWSTFFGTPDYSNCGYYFSPIMPNAKFGSGQVSCVWIDTDLTPPNIPREYLYGKLDTPLIEGEEYFLSYWIYVFNQLVKTKNYQALVIKNQNYNFQGDVLVADPTLSNTEFPIQDEWFSIRGCFTAAGGENRIILGNFALDEDTEFIDTTTSYSDYHMVDEVGLYSLSSLVPKDTVVLVGSIVDLPDYIGQTYQLNGNEYVGAYEFEESGIFEFEVFIEPCGLIGSFEVEVQSCVDYLLDQELEIEIDSIYCLDDYPMWEFSFPEGFQLRIENQEIASPYIFDSLGFYQFYFTHEECGSYDSLSVLIEDCTAEEVVEGHCFYIPNAISPDQEGLNKSLEIQGPCEVQAFYIGIYDRWGNRIFASNDIIDSWEGRSNGLAVASGVYGYIAIIEYLEDENSYIQTDYGTVTVVR